MQSCGSSRLTISSSLSLVVITRLLLGSTLFPYTTLFRSDPLPAQCRHARGEQAALSVPLRRSGQGDLPILQIGRAPSELQSPCNLVCRLLLEKKNILIK